MNISYILDTDWVVSYLNDIPLVVSRVDSLLPIGVGISILSLGELYEGIIFSQNPEFAERKLQDFLSGLQVLPITEGICKIFAQQRGLLRQRGMLIGDVDLFIGSTCLFYRVPLGTNNRQHFERIEDLEIISI